MNEKKSQFGAQYVKATKKDGTTYYYLSVGVYDQKGEYTEIAKEFLDPLKKKICECCGINLNDIE